MSEHAHGSATLKAARHALGISVLLLPYVLGAQPQPSSNPVAPKSCKREALPIVLQLAGGVAGAWLGGMGAWSAIDDIAAPDRRVKGDAGYQPNANTAYAIGSWAGSTLGVFAVGRAAYPHCGSLRSTALGTGVASAFLLLGRHEPYLPLIGIVFVAPLQSIVGTMTFHRW